MTTELMFKPGQLVDIYGHFLVSVNSIWNIYVFVLIGILGWALARAHEFELVQKVLITIVFLFFNSLVIYYFYDTYQDLGKIQREFNYLSQNEYKLIPGGISEFLATFDAMGRFRFIASVITGFGIFVLFIIWSKRVWNFKGLLNKEVSDFKDSNNFESKAE